MNKLFKNHRMGRCKMTQWKWISVKNPCRLIPANHSDSTDAMVCVLTLPEIKEYRRQGYEVEIVEMVLPDAPRRLVDVVAQPKIKRYRIASAHVDTTGSSSLEICGGVGNSVLCCASEDKPSVRRGLPVRKMRGVYVKAVQTYNGKSRKKELLERFVVLVRKQADIAKEMDDIRAELATLLPDDDGNPPVFNLFQPFVDEDKLSCCFNCIFQKFFGALPTERLDGYYAKPIDLIAYFFILVEWERLGNCIFSEKCKKPFFEYINEKVLVEGIGKTERTFYNRLTHTMNDFRCNLMKEPASSNFRGECWKRDFFIKDFLKVLAIFHATEYYKELETRKHA